MSRYVVILYDIDLLNHGHGLDVSENAIDLLTTNLQHELPKVRVDAEIGEYFEVLERLHQFNTRKKVIMLLGSNIGNYYIREP